jgi:hypothetical protein
MRVDHGESTKMDETTADLTRDDLKQQRNYFLFPDIQSTIARIASSVNLICDT